jgi:Cro/C1-type HTH DNA-binding domain
LTASNLANGCVSHIKIEHVGRICELLDCTPNDLFELKPDANLKLPENHALNILRKGETMKNFRELVKDIHVEKLEKIEKMLDELKNSNE